MRVSTTLVGLLLSASAAAQSVLPPYDTTYQFAHLGAVPGISSYGGTAFLPTNPNVLLLSSYPNPTIQAVSLVRNAQGFIVGFGAVTTFATVGGTDGGLAFGPNNVLFATWYGPNRLSQVKAGSAATDRVDDLGPLGVGGSVGTCTFVPAGFPGAGRLKVCDWSLSKVHDLPLTPDGTGTFAPGQASAGVTVLGGPEAMVYMPTNAPLIGGKLLIGEWSAGNLAAYDVDTIGDPIPSTRQLVAGGASSIGGGAVDPISGDIVFLRNGDLLALRVGAVCGTFTGYGVASPGALATPTITGTGCARIGQNITIDTTGPGNGLGIIAAGYETNFPYLNLTVLQSLGVTVVSVLSPAGTGSLALTIPIDPTLGHSHLYLQAAYLDASTTSGLSASAGLDLLIR